MGIGGCALWVLSHRPLSEQGTSLLTSNGRSWKKLDQSGRKLEGDSLLPNCMGVGTGVNMRRSSV